MKVRQVLCKSLEKTFEEGINGLSLEEGTLTERVADQESRVQIYSTGLNFYDLLTLVGKYQYKPPLPFCPCNEAAGIVSQIGSAVKNFKKGDRVMLSVKASGALAEQVDVSEDSLLKIPDSISFVEASALYVAFMTAYHGLVQRGQLKKGETLLVTGAAGGMGVFAISLGKFLGAKVIAAASTDEKLQICTKLGADHVINYSKQDLKVAVDSITNGAGVNVSFLM